MYVMPCILTNVKTTNWEERSRNRAAWEKSIQEEKIHNGMSCYLGTRRGGRRITIRIRRISKV